jgi:ribosome-associated translation inhibitor RaiA
MARQFEPDEKDLESLEEEEYTSPAERNVPEPAPAEDYEVELFLSSDGKHTIHIKTGSRNAQKAIAEAMDRFDFVLARYGTKQAQAVKEYGNGKSGMQNYDDKMAKQDTCPHTSTKFVQSKTPKNPGRWFKSCNDCGAFLGWQD